MIRYAVKPCTITGFAGGHLCWDGNRVSSTGLLCQKATPGWCSVISSPTDSLCPRTKSLGCSVAWSMRPLDDASLGQYIPWTIHPLVDTHVPWTMRPLDDASLRQPVPALCDLTLWDRLTLYYDRPGRTVEEKPAIHYTNLLWLASHDQYLDGGSRFGKHRSGTRRPRDASPKGTCRARDASSEGTEHPRLFVQRHIGRGTCTLS